MKDWITFKPSMGNTQSGIQWLWGGASGTTTPSPERPTSELGRHNVIVATRASELTSEVRSKLSNVYLLNICML
mgnify:CR=1 FL=1